MRLLYKHLNVIQNIQWPTIFSEFIIKETLCHHVSLHLLVVESHHISYLWTVDGEMLYNKQTYNVKDSIRYARWYPNTDNNMLDDVKMKSTTCIQWTVNTQRFLSEDNKFQRLCFPIICNVKLLFTVFVCGWTDILLPKSVSTKTIRKLNVKSSICWLVVF